MSPPAALPHGDAVYRLRRRLEAQAPDLDQVVVKAGERFETDDPFPISLEPADFC